MVTGACEVQTFVPIVRLSPALAAEEQALAALEATELAALPEAATEGEELLLPYAFVYLTHSRGMREGGHQTGGNWSHDPAFDSRHR